MTAFEFEATQDGIRKVYVELTTVCNLDCRMCPRNSYEESAESMAWETFEALIEQVRRIPSVESVSLSGFGEPLVHPRVMDGIARIKQAGLRAEMITNAVLLDGPASERLLDLGLDKLSVSMDTALAAPREPFHAESVARAQANLRNFSERKLARKLRSPEIGLVFVASKQNISELPALHQRAREFGATSIVVSNLIASTPEMGREVLYQHWATTRRTAPIAPWNPVVELPQMDLHPEAIGAMDALRTAGAHVRVGGGDLAGGRMHCRFIHEGFIAVTPNGDISPCLPLLHSHRYYFRDEMRRISQYRLGNILDTPVDEIWARDEYREFRDRVRRFDFSPCIDCSPCHYRETNQEDCYGGQAPRCGECLWAAGLVQCP